MITVATATAADTPALADLLAEMDTFYGDDTAGTREERQAAIAELLFDGVMPTVNVLVAWSDDALVGLASYSLVWPAVGLTRSLYLKELYVRQSDQKQGIGKALMKALAARAAEHKCSRIEWTTDRGNTAAQDFYQAIGASPSQDKIFYRVDEEDLRKLGVRDL